MAGRSLRLGGRTVLCRKPKVQTSREGLSTPTNQSTPILSFLAFQQLIAFVLRYPCVVSGTTFVPPHPPPPPPPIFCVLYTLMLDFRLKFWTNSDTRPLTHCMYQLSKPRAPAINDTTCPLFSHSVLRDPRLGVSRPRINPPNSFLPDPPSPAAGALTSLASGSHETLLRRCYGGDNQTNNAAPRHWAALPPHLHWNSF